MLDSGIICPMANTVILLLCFLFVLASRHWLRSINLNHLKRHGAEIPPGFEGAVDAETLAKTTAYTMEQTRVSLIESAVNNLLLFVFLFGGLLDLYDRWISSLSHSFVVRGWLFFFFLALAQSLLDIPFGLYRTFRIENRYGFNTTTRWLWWTDLFKATAISLLLLSVLVSGALALIKWSPGSWWLWVWGSFAAVTVFLIYLAPYVIEPLFFKFSPVRVEGLEAEIRSMAEKAGVRVSRVMQVDASRRSRHSNAYFTGIGRVKRIVLFDTLLTQMSHREILAILAHEVGHWKKGHIWKRLVLIEVGGLLAAYLAFRLLEWGGLPGLLGLTQSSFPAQLVILGFFASLVAFPLIPASTWLSRRDERQADQFACELSGAPDALAAALIKLSAENLTNLHPHPIYAKFYYSHPPVVERVNRLRRAAQNEESSPVQ